MVQHCLSGLNGIIYRESTGEKWMKLSGDEFGVASLQHVIKDKITKYVSALHYPLSFGPESWGGRGESIIS